MDRFAHILTENGYCFLDQGCSNIQISLLTIGVLSIRTAVDDFPSLLSLTCLTVAYAQFGTS